MATVLVLEDLQDNFLLVRKALGTKHHLRWADSVAAAEIVYDDEVDLALVDIGLPDGDGFQFCHWIRSRNKNVPIVFITAQNSMESRITGYSIGGDDYISKPFDLVELQARVEAKLRRQKLEREAIINRHGLRIDLSVQRVQIIENGTTQDLDLTPLEFKLLNLFLSAEDKLLSRDEIMDRIWGTGMAIYSRSVDTHVSKLRRKLLAKGECIQSVHGVGYKFARPGA